MDLWQLVSLQEARSQATSCLKNIMIGDERVPLREAMGRVAAVDVFCTDDIPAFDRATVDGYALRSAETSNASPAGPAFFGLTEEVRMGKAAEWQLPSGQAAPIPTGGMLPEGADAVVMLEYTKTSGGKCLEVSCPVREGENVVRRGDDAGSGSLAVGRGCRIGVPDIGILAACGIHEVSVVKKPAVTVVTTGDEIVSGAGTLKTGQIWDVNSYTLAALSEEAGCVVRRIVRVRDSEAALASVLAEAAGESDVVLISGGSSVGGRDYTAAAIMKLSGAKIQFHGVALKPGKPSLLAMTSSTALFGLPGHTVAAITVFREIVRPALAALQRERAALPQLAVRAKLGAALQPDRHREEIFRVRLEQQGGAVIAWPLPPKSGLISTMSRAHGLVYAHAGQAEIGAGEDVDVQVMPERLVGQWQVELK